MTDDDSCAVFFFSDKIQRHKIHHGNRFAICVLISITEIDLTSCFGHLSHVYRAHPSFTPRVAVHPSCNGCHISSRGSETVGIAPTFKEWLGSQRSGDYCSILNTVQTSFVVQRSVLVLQ